ncbi:hypothetical protein ACWD00_05975 [Streptomyces viridiviolaceus]
MAAPHARLRPPRCPCTVRAVVGLAWQDERSPTDDRLATLGADAAALPDTVPRP